MKYLVVLLMLVGFSASANQLIARQGDDWVLVTDDACRNEAVIKHLPPNGNGDWRAARGMFGGKLYEACWQVMGGGAGAHIVYEDGDQGVVPSSEFREPGTV